MMTFEFVAVACGRIGRNQPAFNHEFGMENIDQPQSRQT
jgi:hypothetical protein